MSGDASGPGATRVSYGPEADTFAELSAPAGGGPWPVAVLLHGGYWRVRHTLGLMRPLAADLAARGVAAWNLEYRRGSGAWRDTLADVAAGVDALREAAGRWPFDLARVAFVGHSAGGQLATWAAARPDAAVRPEVVVSLAGVSDLAAAAEAGLGEGAAVAFLGVAPSEDPEPYRRASPVARLPIGARQVLVHGDADARVPIEMSRRYRDLAVGAGDPVELVELPGVDHMSLVDPGGPAWRAVTERLGALLG